MNPEDIQRIEEAARVHADRYNINQYYYEGIFDGYIDGAKAEHSRMTNCLKEERNDAIDACIKICGGHWNIADWLELRRKLEALKR